MAIREWAAADFATDEERVRHCARAHEHYRLVFECWHWILGPGALEDSPRALESQRIAERERKKHGWTLDTLEDAHFRWKTAPLARSRFQALPPKAADSGARGGSLSGALASAWYFDPPPTVERDYPESFEYASSPARRLTMLQDACDEICRRNPATASMTRAFYASLIASASADVAADAAKASAPGGAPGPAPTGPELASANGNGHAGPRDPGPGDTDESPDPNPF